MTRLPVPPSRLFLVAIVLVFVFELTAVDAQENPLKAELGNESVWIGEPASLEIKLYSPGPFSGVPTFEIPEIKKVYILRTGRPTVGSEDVDGENLFTQTYQFEVISQTPGDIVIPPFQVRFEGQESFVGDPVPLLGVTPKLSFVCRRPPGVDGDQMVLGANRFEVQQQWEPEPTLSSFKLKAGEVVRRTITRSSSGSISMAYPELSISDDDGIRIYQVSPTVDDNFEDGVNKSLRTDVIKYQFERGGQFEIPPLEFVWWDYANEKLNIESVNGITVEVEPSLRIASENGQTGDETNRSYATWIYLIGAISFAVFFARFVFRKWMFHLQQPEVKAVREIYRHCHDNNPEQAYISILAWLQITGLDANQLGDCSNGSSFLEELKSLSSLCYGRNRGDAWNGKRLAEFFQIVNTEIKRQNVRARRKHSLPSLNPTDGFELN